MPLVAGDVYFDIRSIGDRYGKFVGAVDSQGEPGKCCHSVILKNSVSLKKMIWMLKRHLMDGYIHLMDPDTVSQSHNVETSPDYQSCVMF